jgi:hypothetical protein
MPSKRNHRPQKAEQIDLTDTRSVNIAPISTDDRRRNPKDLDIDEAAIRNGVEHGGTQSGRAEQLATRGTGGRKRSGAFGRHRVGRDVSKRR